MSTKNQQYLDALEGKTARQIIEFVRDLTGYEITITLKSKKQIIKKAVSILADYYSNTMFSSAAESLEEEAVKSGLTTDRYEEHIAHPEDDMIDIKIEYKETPLQVLDLTGVSRWSIAKMYRNLTNHRWGLLSILFGSRTEMARELLKAYNMDYKSGTFDDFIC